MTGVMRLRRTQAVVDPKTGKKTPADTELVRRFKASGMGVEDMLDLPVLPSAMEHESFQTPESLKKSAFTTLESSEQASRLRLERGMSSTEVVELTRWDIFHDVSGRAPMLSLNYISVASFILMMFDKMEHDLKALRNPIYMEAYEDAAPPGISSRMLLVCLALEGENDECLQTMATIFEEWRTGFMKHMYWDDIDTMDARQAKMKDHESGNVAHLIPALYWQETRRIDAMLSACLKI